MTHTSPANLSAGSNAKTSETLWIFAYGSLVWHAGFDPAERVPARLEGWQRRFCLCSEHYRGTAKRPGLVLALDHRTGALCVGLALKVRAGEEDAALAVLRARELARPAYRETIVPITLQDGRMVSAVTFVANRNHASYRNVEAGEQVRIIAFAEGEKGPNRDYLWNTADHLREIGIGDPDLDRLSAAVRDLVAEAVT